MDIETLQNDLAIVDLNSFDPETATGSQLQIASATTPVIINSSFIPSSPGVEQQLNAYQMQPYYSDMQPTNPPSNMYDVYNPNQI